jgi:predicted ATPase
MHPAKFPAILELHPLLERIASEPHTRLRCFGSPQRTDSALYPIINQMERAARFAHDDTVQAKLDKLDALLTQSSTPRQDAALLSEMLSLPNDGRYPALELTPQQRRQKNVGRAACAGRDVCGQKSGADDL